MASLAQIFGKVNRALSGKGDGVKRKAQTDDKDLRAKRERERIARRRKERKELLKTIGAK